MRAPAAVTVAVVAVVVTSCSGPPHTDSGRHGRIRAVRIATLDQPVALSTRRRDSALYVAERTGRVVAIRRGRVDHRPVLDLSARVSLGGEQGLLGLAFSPGGRYVYVDFTDRRGQTRVVGYRFEHGRALLRTRRLLLSIHQRFND